ncbi:MAG: folylpolyglutamate synthase/dihydrofolate synthase family protein [Cyanobacteria bacterium J06621_8]
MVQQADRVDSLLSPYQRFGVNLGLSRIKKLLADLGNPQHQVPIIHVAGSNGKGSVCAYLSSILLEAGYRVGRYTSPHLVDWTERIQLNGQAIADSELLEILHDVRSAVDPETESPTQFEIITAAAWLYFARSQVDVAVIEVGLGGRLDATNVKDDPLVSIITSLSKEHWQRLGPTLADIAREKAGVIKQQRPVILGQLPTEAKTVVLSRAEALAAPVTIVEPAMELNLATSNGSKWARYEDVEYPLPLLGKVQLSNSALAIAAVKNLQQQGWQIPELAIQTGISKTRWQGRLQWSTWRNHPLLIDGAHNPDAAKALRQYADTLEQPLVWVMGMLSNKDHEDVFRVLLQPGDELHLVPVPEHSSADPEELASLANEVCPQLSKCQTYQDIFVALDRVMESVKSSAVEQSVVLCGSLYLIGHLFQHTNIAQGNILN